MYYICVYKNDKGYDNFTNKHRIKKYKRINE